MFNSKKDNENDFCESYKSEILGTTPSKKENSFFSTLLKLLTILILLAIIIGVSFYGYTYYMDKQKENTMALPPVSMQISDEDLVVEAEDVEEAIVTETVKEENVSLPKIELQEEKQVDQKKQVDETNEINEEVNSSVKEPVSLEVPTSAPEAKYLEELADLSKEIDKERKK